MGNDFKEAEKVLEEFYRDLKELKVKTKELSVVLPGGKEWVNTQSLKNINNSINEALFCLRQREELKKQLKDEIKKCSNKYYEFGKRSKAGEDSEIISIEMKETYIRSRTLKEVLGLLEPKKKGA